MKSIVAYWKMGWKVRALFGIAGAGVGYLYYYTIGCDGGCPITGNPWTSIAYGAFVGLLAYPGPSREQPQDSSRSENQEGTDLS